MHLYSAPQTNTLVVQDQSADTPFDPAAFSSLVADPAHTEALRNIQNEAHALLDQAVADLILALGVAEPLRPTLGANSVVNVRALATSSRQSTEAALARRKFARDMIIAGLLNRQNDEWDMTDASTYQTETSDPVVALLRMPGL
ncbi:hypothetical protein [Actimicrobium antarcticum]|uniref:Uncharacterized protein n=1 Tax=Actimicrobium antarcticum TaxID=1051899 RepID=A0ABP7SGP7_9BURK